ncbi:MAG: patatin-like phospholipase family protein [Pseudomonadota bacterium]
MNANENPESQKDQKTVDLKGDIGLTLSGGGYRAAAFHLGVIDFLQNLGMLDQLRKISTVSGGTFTGVKYTLYQVEGKSYDEFFTEYYGFMATTDLLKLGLDQLGSGKPQVPSGRRDVATAMAQVYADTFLKRPDGTPYLFGDILNAEIPLRDTVFNATEFRHGLAFRFQRSDNSRARIGNYRVSISKEDAEKIRMADIVTASSSFPGGFEPFAFPNDFAWPGGQVPENLQRQFSSGPIALMDGGVYDNQGLQSLLLADERDQREEELAMFIISDVDQKSKDLYPYPADENRGGLTLNALAILSIVFIVVLAISLVMLLGNLLTEPFSWYNFFLVTVPAAQVGFAAYALIWVRRKVKKALDKIPLVGRAAWKDIKLLTVDDVIDMISLRISSLFAMAGSVFMKRIRSLVYGLVYGDFRKPVRKVLDNLYGEKRISNLIYHLQSGEEFSKELKRAGINEPSAALRKVTDRAATMPTTLWFDKKDELPSLVASGQATLCYNLMKYLVRNFGENPADFPPDAGALWNKLVEDWEEFNKVPLHLVEKRLERA